MLHNEKVWTCLWGPHRLWTERHYWKHNLCNKVVGRYCFHRCLSVILFRGSPHVTITHDALDLLQGGTPSKWDCTVHVPHPGPSPTEWDPTVQPPTLGPPPWMGPHCTGTSPALDLTVQAPPASDIRCPSNRENITVEKLHCGVIKS